MLTSSSIGIILYYYSCQVTSITKITPKSLREIKKGQKIGGKNPWDNLLQIGALSSSRAISTGHAVFPSLEQFSHWNTYVHDKKKCRYVIISLKTILIGIKMDFFKNQWVKVGLFTFVPILIWTQTLLFYRLVDQCAEQQQVSSSTWWKSIICWHRVRVLEVRRLTHTPVQRIHH